ncbi:competence protein ComEA helix-hairpin-helix repeat region [Marivirga sericea]|uniref:Competence protein ComEA helix-hairpin-helix repeat region n=1 Tax=Marivirga sericea TaxID=1028 RepID=A0A1X7J285_9BACT|nr:helix-hairpin-helix domain-containing protein [Marivirga sericea]SMG21314.1 competence protein ComEA helix-hairpin-helix repeat region [Marivirga sericea]
MKHKIRIWLRNFFGFSRTETNGFIILILLMIIILAIPFISKSLYSFYAHPLPTQQDKALLDSLLSELEDATIIKKEIGNEENFKHFDLNKSKVPHLIKAGFPEYLAERIVKYRNKVSPFESKEELLKIYGIDSSFYAKIYPYMSVTKVPSESHFELPEENSKPSQYQLDKIPKLTNEKLIQIQIDINKADSLQLQEIHGIGPAFSSRIIKYREYLGGFHSIQQLDEVYGLQKQNLDSLKKHVHLSTKELHLKQLNINQLSTDSLVKHPYISYKKANILVNYRKQHGKFKSVSDLLSIKILDSSWVNKVKPYISFE